MPPRAPTNLRRAIVHLIEHASDPAVLLTVADALNEATREASLLGSPTAELADLTTIALCRAQALFPASRDRTLPCPA